MLIETNNLSLIFTLESDTVMDFVPITARYCQCFTVPITVPVFIPVAVTRSFITVPVTVTVLLLSLPSHFRVQFNESDVS